MGGDCASRDAVEGPLHDGGHPAAIAMVFRWAPATIKAVGQWVSNDNSPVTLPRSRLGQRQPEQGWPRVHGEANDGPLRHNRVNGEEVAQ